MTATPVPLAWGTPSGWAAVALADPVALLSDHAHCELGAAAAAQSLLSRRPRNGRLVAAMSALAIEELRHFRRVHRELRARGAELRPAVRNPYVTGLRGLVGERGAEPTEGDGAMVDRLLVAALIEARSLERFELLAAAAVDGALAELYAELGRSEAGHARLFVELAGELAPAGRVAGRLEALAAGEAALVRALPPGPRIHSGPPAPEADA